MSVSIWTSHCSEGCILITNNKQTKKEFFAQNVTTKYQIKTIQNDLHRVQWANFDVQNLAPEKMAHVSTANKTAKNIVKNDTKLV